jgi:hypothetical protein
LFTLGSLSKCSPFWDAFFNSWSYALFLTKIVWATLWAILSKTHLVALITRTEVAFFSCPLQGLVFLTYPDLVLELPFSVVWAVIFFLMLLVILSEPCVHSKGWIR